MKKTLLLALTLTAVLFAGSCSQYKYEKVSGDPLQAKIYTLDNGLKVYMTVNKDEPRIQTYIAVHSGGKNDPSDNTGLAHYLEHMMFKGSQHFGTVDYAKEKPMLDSIDSLFEVYRSKTDQGEREAIYHQIDSISYEASKLAIPNEYDKLMSVIGSKGSNAFTSNDETVYTEDIPSNEIENWAKIEADRFKNCVFRGFHTELEAVYEEKNMGLTDDGEKSLDAIDSMLFKNHPYGTQTVIGTQEHLKNPSIKTIRHQKDTYYVPNNVAICLSGDFDPDEMITIIKKYFGDWQPNKNLPKFTFAPEAPVSAPMVKDVYGNDAEFVMMGWRTPGASSTDSDLSEIAGAILSNNMAGLIDIDLNQAQKVIGAGAFPYDRTDYGVMFCEASPKEGQTLEEVRDLLLAEVAKLRDGKFSDTLFTATLNNYKLQQMKSLEQNRSRAMMFVNSFINGTQWKTEVQKMDRMSKYTKKDVVDWAGKYLAPESYAVVFKHIGEDKNIKKIAAPKITPTVTNRDFQSDFLKEIQAAQAQVKPIEPVFVDYSKDLSKFQDKGIEVLYKKNVKNDIAEVSYIYDMGSIDDPALNLAATYVGYLSTPSMSATEIASKMYDLACEFNIRVNDNRTVITISGLGENIGTAMDIVENLIENAQGDTTILSSLKNDELKSRADAKLNQRACEKALGNYVVYGADYIQKTTLNNEQLKGITSEVLLSKIKGLMDKQHKVLYYGPQSKPQFTKTLADHHKVAQKPEPVVKQYAQKQQTPQNKVVIAQYDSRQFNYMQYSDRGEKFDLASEPYINLYNDYFGGGMNTIVFQEMRESRALAYHASAYLYDPSFIDDTYSFRAEIASQNDKLQQAIEAFALIINDMPESEKNLDIAKTGLMSRLRTNRVIGDRVLFNYLNDRELGLSEPRDKGVFEKVDSLKMTDLVATQQKWIKGRTYVYAILGDTKDMDMNYLKTLGPVEVVSLETIFGY